MASAKQIAWRKKFAKMAKSGKFKKSTKSNPRTQGSSSSTLINEIKRLNAMAKEQYDYFNTRALGKKDVTVRERGEWSVWSEIMNRTQGMLERHGE